MNNSMFLGAMSVLKESASVVQTPSSNTLNLIHTHESSFVSGVNAIIEKNQSYHECKMNLYKAIAESAGDVTVILEGFADYAVQARDISDKFLKFIDRKIYATCCSIIDFIDGDGGIVNEYSAALKALKYYDNDSREGYQYTFDENIPDMSVLDRFNESLFEELVQSQWNDLSIESIQSVLANIDLEQDYRKARGAILKTDMELSENEYEACLRAVFRDGKSSVIELDVDAESIKSILDKWQNRSFYNKTLKEDMQRLVKAMDAVLDRIDAVCRNNNGLTLSAFTHLLPGDIRVDKVNGKDVDIEGMRMAPEMMVQLDLFCKLKLDQLQKYTDLICLALTAKADAMYDSVQQNFTILNDCITIMKENPKTYDYALKEVKK